MNIISKKQAQRRLKSLSIYKDKVDEKCNLASHLLNQTISKLNKENQELKSLLIEINVAENGLEKGIVSGSVFSNIYNYHQQLTTRKKIKEDAITSINTEHARRLKEYQHLKVRSMGIDRLIEKTKTLLSQMEYEKELSELTEWTQSRHGAKR